MIEIKGFCEIKIDATTCKGAKNPNEFTGEVCRVMDFGCDDSVLVLNPKGTALAMFDKEDVLRSFKCSYFNGVVLPPNLDLEEKLVFHYKLTTRKGGYNNLLANIVIANSLIKGEYDDRFLFAKQ